MKRILLIVSIILIQKVLFAQNWAPLISVDKYNFRLNNSNVVASATWVDYVQFNSGDSVFLLNRTSMCENCLIWIGGVAQGPPVCDSCYGLRNLPEFLQRVCVAHPNGVFNFLHPANLVINSLSSVGNSWVFDSILNIQANVISIGFDSIFGSLDSIKTILLSSGDTIQLSKNFGILKFPNGYSQNSYYRLTGIEGRNVGEIVPKFFDFYDINIGDMFEYLDTSNVQGTYYTIRKYAITSKQIYGDTIVFGINGLKKNWNLSGGSSYSVINTQMTVTNTVNHITNSSYHDQSQQVSSLYGHVKFSFDSLNLLVKEIGNLKTGQPLSFPISTGSDTMKQTYDPYYAAAVYYKYVVGLGLTDYAINHAVSGSHSEHLTAYRKGIDTVGLFTPDSELTSLTGIKTPYNNNLFSVYPNPSNTTITVYVNHFINENSRITISDIESRIILSYDLNNSMLKTLDISSFANGIYVLKIDTGDDSFIKKLVVQR